jgi:hypothetical protein
VRASVPREAFYRHLRVIRAAGLPLPAQSAKRPSEADQAGAALLSLPGRRVKLRRGAPCAPEGGTGEVYEVLFRHGRWWVELAIDPPASCPDAHAVDFAELDMGEFKRWAEICYE